MKKGFTSFAVIAIMQIMLLRAEITDVTGHDMTARTFFDRYGAEGITQLIEVVQGDFEQMVIHDIEVLKASAMSLGEIKEVYAQHINQVEDEVPYIMVPVLQLLGFDCALRLLAFGIGLNRTGKVANKLWQNGLAQSLLEYSRFITPISLIIGLYFGCRFLTNISHHSVTTRKLLPRMRYIRQQLKAKLSQKRSK